MGVMGDGREGVSQFIHQSDQSNGPEVTSIYQGVLSALAVDTVTNSAIHLSQCNAFLSLYNVRDIYLLYFIYIREETSYAGSLINKVYSRLNYS